MAYAAERPPARAAQRGASATSTTAGHETAVGAYRRVVSL